MAMQPCQHPAAFAEAAPYGYLTPSKSSLVDEGEASAVMEVE